MIFPNHIKDLYQNLCQYTELPNLEAKKIQEQVGNSVMQTICAYANEQGLKHGFLLLGVSEPDKEHDNFWVSGVNNPEKILSDIQNNCRTQFTRVIEIDAGIATIDNKTVIAIKVFELDDSAKPCGFASASDKKNYKKKGVWRRGVNGDYEATLDELTPLLMAKSGKSYEQTLLSNATLEDIDPKHLKRYRQLRREVSPNATELHYDDTDLLSALNLIQTDKEGVIRPNIAGMLLFGKDSSIHKFMPMVRVDYIRHIGERWVEDADRRFLYTNDFHEALISVLPKLEATIIDDLPKHFHLPDNSLQRADTPLLPRKVIREAVVNMLMHRDYAIHQPSQINRFSNRIEMTNAGYSLKPLNDTTKGSYLRNPIIAKVLYDLDFAETKGSGWATMQGGLKAVGLTPPKFESSRESNTFEVTLLLQNLVSEAQLNWLKKLGSLTDLEAVALTLAHKFGQIDNKTLRQHSDKDSLTVSKTLKKLCNQNRLVQHGKSTATYYTLHPDVPLLQIHTDEAPANANHYSDPATQDTATTNPNTGLNKPNAGVDNTNAGVNAGVDRPNAGVNAGLDNTNAGVNAGVDELFELSQIPADEFEKLLKIAKPSLSKSRLQAIDMQMIILALCQHRPLSPKALAVLLNRTSDTLRKNYLKPLTSDSLLSSTYPDTLNHPQQTYFTTEQGKLFLAQHDKYM